MPQLIVKQGPNLGATVTVETDAASIGRDRTNDVYLPHDTISRHHARLLYEDGSWTVSDLNSSNGTQVNGRKVEREQLRHMDEIQLGEAVLIFIDDTSPLFGEEEDAAEITQTLDSSTIEMLRVETTGTGEAERVNRGVIQLFRLSNEVGACKTMLELMGKLSAAAAEALSADRIVPITVEANGHLRPWFGRRSASNAVLAELPISTTVVNHVRKNGKAVLSEIQGDERFDGSASVVRNSIATAMCVPLKSGGREFGVIYADRIAPAEPFSQTEFEMLAAMAMPVTVAVENILAAEDLKSEREHLVGQMKLDHNIIGKHETITEVLDLVQRVAPTDSSVLIVGQSGTGKELIARAIHYNSARSGKAFEAVNCAALASALIESELFGHVKGAFTGAIQDKPGRFELADSGTLFLDEIGEMPLDSQSKLLRVIEQGELRRVGDTRDRQVDVRIVAATNKPLDEMAAEGKFREDLFYRLNIVRIDLPPLGSRGDDVDLLADHFLEFFCAKCGRKPLTLSVKARALLRKYSWPGNVRELKNVMERLAVVCRDDDVRPEDLPPEVRAGRARSASAGDASASLADVEREHIIRVMAHTAGNKKEAAAILGIDRSTLYSKLKQYEID